MADRLRLRIFTPAEQLVDADVTEVITPAHWGQLGILPDHAALVTTLEPGELAYRAGGQVQRLRVGAGLAEIRDNVMTVLAESGERVA